MDPPRAGRTCSSMLWKQSPTPKIATSSLYACGCYQDRDNTNWSAQINHPLWKARQKKKQVNENLEAQVMLIWFSSVSLKTLMIDYRYLTALRDTRRSCLFRLERCSLFPILTAI